MNDREREFLLFYEKYRIKDQVGYYTTRLDEFDRATGQGLFLSASILGFASAVGMNAEEIFRDTQAQSAAGQRPLAESIRYALRDGTPLRQVKAEYVTPAGEHREIQVTVSRVAAADASSIGATCLITDQTQIAQILRQQDMRREMSAEMALALRNSLVTISGYAQQLAQNRDPEVARQLAADIAAESAHLDRTIGGFLAGASAASA